MANSAAVSVFSSFEWLIGVRYVRPRRAAHRNRFISFISAISMGGIALGVAALIVVLSVMNGFQKEVRDRMLAVLSHVEVFDADNALTDWPRIADASKRNSEVVAAAPYVAGQAMFAREDQFRGALVRGIDPALEDTVADIADKVRGGTLADLTAGDFNIILGRDLAAALGLRVGDRVALIVPQGNVTPAGLVPRLRQFNIVGTFESGHFEYDSALAFVNIDDARKLFRMPGITGVRLKLRDMQRAPEVAADLAQHLPGDLYVRDWTRQNRAWFAAVQTEKRMMFIILTLIIMVAAFNLVSTLVMTVTDKQSDIAILRTLGAAPRSIMQIFVLQGALIGSIGVLAGVAAGAAIAFNIDVIVPVIERVLHVQFLPKDIYFISSLPSDPRASDIATIGVVAFALSLVATLYPSWSASRVKPAEALRYE